MTKIKIQDNQIKQSGSGLNKFKVEDDWKKSKWKRTKKPIRNTTKKLNIEDYHIKLKIEDGQKNKKLKTPQKNKKLKTKIGLQHFKIQQHWLKKEQANSTQYNKSKSK